MKGSSTVMYQPQSGAAEGDLQLLMLLMKVTITPTLQQTVSFNIVLPKTSPEEL